MYHINLYLTFFLFTTIIHERNWQGSIDTNVPLRKKKDKARFPFIPNKMIFPHKLRNLHIQIIQRLILVRKIIFLFIFVYNVSKFFLNKFHNIHTSLSPFVSLSRLFVYFIFVRLYII